MLRAIFKICVAGILLSACFSGSVASTCESFNKDWIFCEDFESGSLKKWDKIKKPEQSGRDIFSHPGPTQLADNQVLRLRVPPGRGGRGINKTFTPKQYKRLYARWYQYYEPGFDFTAKNHGHGFHAGDRWKKGVAGFRPNGDDYFTINLEYLPQKVDRPARPYLYTYYHGMYMDCNDPKGSCWGDHFPCMVGANYCRKLEYKPDPIPPALRSGHWYCMELMVDAGDAVSEQSLANGRLNFWVDGVSIGEWSGLWFRTQEDILINHFWLGLFHHDEHSVEGIMYDDVVVSTERIGCF